MLDVDELEADRVRAPRGSDEVVDQPIELVVGHHRARRRESACRAPDCAYAARGSGRFQHVRPREAARVRELEAEVEIARRRSRRNARAMRADELVAERAERRLGAAPTISS